jgi:hypothetical protein
LMVVPLGWGGGGGIPTLLKKNFKLQHLSYSTVYDP